MTTPAEEARFQQIVDAVKDHPRPRPSGRPTVLSAQDRFAAASASVHRAAANLKPAIPPPPLKPLPPPE